MFILTNFKNHKEGTFENAIKLAKIHEEISTQEWVNLIIAPSVFDLEKVCEVCSNTHVYAQSCHSVDLGSTTGKIPPAFLKKLGVDGVIVNHAENTVSMDEIKLQIVKIKEEWLKVLVCVANLEEAKEIDLLSPNFISLEPPNLIWGDMSITIASPDIIKNFVKCVKNAVPLVWAWIKTEEDIKKSSQLGSKWILVSSWVVKSKNPKKVLENFVKAIS